MSSEKETVFHVLRASSGVVFGLRTRSSSDTNRVRYTKRGSFGEVNSKSLKKQLTLNSARHSSMMSWRSGSRDALLLWEKIDDPDGNSTEETSPQTCRLFKSASLSLAPTPIKDALSAGENDFEGLIGIR